MDKILYTKQKIANKNWQKFCTGEDWSDAAFAFVLKNIFKKNASYHRKQWEFVVIFLSLVDHGKLHESSIGASFGAGKEALIYDLLPFVKSFLATDLYSWSTGWDTARLGEQDTPYDFLKRHAPKGLNIDNLKATEMDMRQLDILDNSLDFCYSSCAVEHIGDRQDFIQHFKEVKRVLKEDGVYVMTTELLFNHETIATVGNFKFNIEYLRKLFLESGLDVVSTFDATCEKNRLNIPRPYVQPLIGSNNLEKLFPVSAILDIEGVPYTSCCFILSPSKQKTPKTFEVIGMDKSAEFLKKKSLINMRNTYLNKRNVDPFYSLKKKSRLYLDDHLQYRFDENQTKPKIQLDQPNFCYTNFIWFADSTVDIEIKYEINDYKGQINWLLIEKEQMQLRNRKKIDSIKVNCNKDMTSQRISFSFNAKANKVYAILGQFPKRNFKINMEIKIETLNVTAKIK